LSREKLKKKAITLLEINKADVAERLREFGQKKFGKMTDFAAALEISGAQLHSTYLNGRSLPGAELLLKLAKMGCDIAWLLSGNVIDPTDFNDFYEKAPPLQEFPIISTISAGDGIGAFEDLSEYKHAKIPYKHNSGALLVVKGKSMEPLIKDGDVILVDYKKEIGIGDFVAFRLKDTTQFVKRLVEKKGGVLKFESLNKEEFPILLIHESDIQAIFKVTVLIKNIG